VIWAPAACGGGALSRAESFGLGRPGFDRWRRGRLIAMSDLIEDAVKALRSLPDDVQAAAARAIIDYSAGAQEVEA
jgi:hypothetical protein